MKILVMSDSHASFSFMRRCIEVIEPDAMIHLGDYYRDAQTLAEEYPNIPLYQVPGNCDLYHSSLQEPEIRIVEIGGVRLFLTHGHRHNVKNTLRPLEKDARAANVQAVLFGHTHSALCCQDDGLWILNPGACSWGGSAGLIITHLGKITNCRILRPEDVKD